MPVSPALILRRRQAGRIRPQLDGLRRALGELGNPERDFSSILIVGTNGKGSTAAMLEAILRAHGVATGLYTSPHLVRVEERITVGGERVDEIELSRRLGRLDGFADLTYFETLTAAAFEIFSSAGTDVAVLEAGMGGSWDATRLADSIIAGITNVGSDHRHWLGDDRRTIAADKGGALAAADRAVIGRGVGEDLIGDLEAPDAIRAADVLDCTDDGDGRARLRWDDRNVVVELPLRGEFQRDNLQLGVALALQAVALGWLPELEPQRVRRALGELRWPGRLSSHRLEGREVLVDCAHNLEAAHALAGFLDRQDRRYNLLFSCLDDKPLADMVSVLRPRVGNVAVCALADDRAMPVDDLAAAFEGAVVAEAPLDGLELLDDPILAAGSVRLVGELLAHEDAGS